MCSSYRSQPCVLVHFTRSNSSIHRWNHLRLLMPRPFMCIHSTQFTPSSDAIAHPPHTTCCSTRVPHPINLQPGRSIYWSRSLNPSLPVSRLALAAMHGEATQLCRFLAQLTWEFAPPPLPPFWCLDKVLEDSMHKQNSIKSWWQKGSIKFLLLTCIPTCALTDLPL